MIFYCSEEIYVNVFWIGERWIWRDWLINPSGNQKRRLMWPQWIGLSIWGLAVREGRKEFIPSVNLSFDVTQEKWGYLGLGATWSNMFSESLEVDVSSVSNSKCLILISVSSHLSDCSVTAIFLCRCLFSSPLIVLSQNVTSRNSFSSLASFFSLPFFPP